MGHLSRPGRATAPRRPAPLLTVPLLLVAAVVSSTAWVAFARGGAPGDGTVTFPSAPYWSARGVVIDEVLPRSSDLRVGDCVVAVDGRSLEDLVRTGSGVPRRVGDVLRYDIRRDGDLGGSCDGPAVAVDVRLEPYPFGAVVQQHLSVVLLAVALLVLGAVLVAARPRLGATRALLLAACLYPFGVTEWPFGTQVVDLANGPRLWPFVVGDTANALFWGALLLMAWALPRAGPLPRWMVAAGLATPLLLHLGFLAATLPGQHSQLGRLARLVTVSLPSAYLVPILMVVALAVGYRSVDLPEKRTAIRWVLVPFALAASAYVGLGQLPAAITGVPIVPWTWLYGSFVLVLSAMALAVVRNHLFEVRVVLRRWGLRAAGFVVGAATVVGVWRLLAPSWSVEVLPAAALGVVSLVIFSGLVALDRRLQRRVFGARADGDLMITALSSQALPIATGEREVVATLEVLMDTLRLAFVQLDLDLPDAGRLVLSRGTPQAADRVVPLRAGDVSLGRLSVAVRPGLEPLGRSDRRLLDVLAQVIGSNAYNVALQQALRAALARAVSAGEEERRRVRREIHDGIGPLLAASLLRTEIAIHAATANATSAASAVDADALKLLHQLQERALNDLRRLVEELRPAVLDHEGLSSALRQHADLSNVALTADPPTVDIESAGDLSGLPAAVEVAAYRIGQEALTNAIKHAGARRILVRLRLTADALVLDVVDDGTGFDPAGSASGIGLVSMRERATELGGTIAYESSPPGGTTVRAVLPIVGPAVPDG